MMTTAVTSTPIKVELIEECSFVNETAEENKTDDNTKNVEVEEEKDVSSTQQSGAKSSGKNKATRPGNIWYISKEKYISFVRKLVVSSYLFDVNWYIAVKIMV